MASCTERQPGAADITSTAPISKLRRHWQLVEVLAFLSLIVPSMALSFLGSQQLEQLSFVVVAVSIMSRDLGLAALIMYLVWRNGESFRQLGWRGDRIGREVLIGVLLFPVFVLLVQAVDWGFLQLGLSSAPKGSVDFLKPHGAAQLALTAAFMLVVAVTEETIFRGYLLLRLTAVSQSTVAAVILSSLIFSVGHGYEGTAGVATVGVMGMIFALIYLWRGSLVAPVTMHFLQDFIAILLLTFATSPST